MTDEKIIKKRKKKFYPKNKEQASKKKEPKDLNKKLEELQAFINGKYHTP